MTRPTADPNDRTTDVLVSKPWRRTAADISVWSRGLVRHGPGNGAPHGSTTKAGVTWQNYFARRSEFASVFGQPMLTIQHCKESLSRAYVTAVVGRSRNNLLWGREYDYGVDGTVRILEQRGSNIRETGMGFDFQSKSTVDWRLQGSDIVYDLEVQAYNDLVDRAGSACLPFLLILLCLPKNDSEWLDVSADKLILQKCAYWIKLNGSSSTNKNTCSIHIPTTNVFTPQSVIDILRDIKSGAMVP